MNRCAVIAAADSPVSGYYVSALLERLCMPACIVLDERSWSRKDRAIHEERTAGRLPDLPAERLSAASDLVFVADHNGEQAIAAIRDRGCRVVVNAGTPRILTSGFLDAFDAVLNCHPGMLPKYRGCSCVEWAVFNDDPVGNTVHLMTTAIDEGPIVRSEAVAVTREDDYPSVRLKVFARGWGLLADTTRAVLAGTIDVRRLPPQSNGVYWHPIDEERMAAVARKLALGRYRYQMPGAVA